MANVLLHICLNEETFDDKIPSKHDRKYDIPLSDVMPELHKKFADESIRGQGRNSIDTLGMSPEMKLVLDYRCYCF